MTIIDDAVSEIRLTTQGRAGLADRARRLREETIPRLVEHSDSPDRHDSVGADWERATSELAGICTVLAAARPAEALPDDPQVVELGETITIRIDGGATERYVVVHPAEAVVRSEGVSSRSPLGQALLGRRIGDEVEVTAPGGSYRCVIERATRERRFQYPSP